LSSFIFAPEKLAARRSQSTKFRFAELALRQDGVLEIAIEHLNAPQIGVAQVGAGEINRLQDRN